MPELRPVLSLAELEAHDPRATGHGTERRFRCPLCHGRGRHLAANAETGAWHCHRCGVSGKLREFWTERTPGFSPSRTRHQAAIRSAFTLTSTASADVTVSPLPGASSKSASWERRLDHVQDIAGSPAADYLTGRGIALALAARAEVGYHPAWKHWTKDGDRWKSEGTDRRVVFGLQEAAGGPLVAITARAIDLDFIEPKHDTRGDRSAGIFLTPGALDGDVWIVTEAPIDALSLATAGYPAVAICGTSWPAWLRRAAAFKTVLQAFDNDQAGDKAADALAADLNLGSRCHRVKPTGKDWNDDLVQLGVQSIRNVMAPYFPTETEPSAFSVDEVAAPSDQTTAERPPSFVPPTARCYECKIADVGPGGYYCPACMASYYEANPAHRPP